MRYKRAMRALLDFILRDWRHDFITIKAISSSINVLVEWLTDKLN